MSEIIFFGALTCLILLIFLLNLILSAIDREQSEETGDSENAHGSPNNQEGHTDYDRLVSQIADAIHAYRRYRRSDEHHRAKRENVTVVVLGLTAIFALFAAGAAIYSAWIFSHQLNEMHQASVDTASLA